MTLSPWDLLGIVWAVTFGVFLGASLILWVLSSSLRAAWREISPEARHEIRRWADGLSSAGPLP